MYGKLVDPRNRFRGIDLSEVLPVNCVSFELGGGGGGGGVSGWGFHSKGGVFRSFRGKWPSIYLPVHELQEYARFVTRINITSRNKNYKLQQWYKQFYFLVTCAYTILAKGEHFFALLTWTDFCVRVHTRAAHPISLIAQQIRFTCHFRYVCHTFIILHICELSTFYYYVRKHNSFVLYCRDTSHRYYTTIHPY
jgi:hypothetical protein